MAKIRNDIPEVLDRDYTDNFSIKEYARNTLVPKYFEGEDISDLNIGLTGYVTELISDGLEDTFNTASALHNEMYPNRAKLPSSIMSYGSIFQITNGICTPASCEFLLVMSEKYVIDNFQDINNQNLFYIDKDTKILVEDLIFSLDYDIVIKGVWKEAIKSYIYSAQYDITKFRNSISDITNPYIKLNKSNNGYIAILVKAHQVQRVNEYEHIINNTKINLPNFSVNYDKQLGGFDILYKGATDVDYSTQLQKLMKYSSPLKVPFCYYSINEDKRLDILFSNRDNYFQPDYNSECKIIMYLTDGKKGNFEVYTGKDVSVITTSERFPYNDNFFLVAKVMSPSTGGTDVRSLEEVQALTVEGFRTATVYSTDNDLEEYFSNYKYRFGNECIFIKKRDDLVDRLYSGFLIIRKDDFIYPTNTMYINANLFQFKHSAGTEKFTLEPGTLFTYDSSNDYAKIIKDDTVTVHTYTEYNQWLADNHKTQHDISYYEYLTNLGDSNLTGNVFNQTLVDSSKTTNQFLYFNPFLVSVSRRPNLVGLYLTVVNQNSVVDFTDQNLDMFEQFLVTNLTVNRGFTKEKKYHIETATIPSSNIPSEEKPVKVFGPTADLTQNNLRVVLTINGTTGEEVCVTEMIPTFAGNSNDYHFAVDIETDDHTDDARFRLTRGVTGIVNNWDNLIPMEAVCHVYVLYKNTTGSNRFSQYIPTLSGYSWTNHYTTTVDPITFIKPLNMIKSNLIFKDYRLGSNSMSDVSISSIPLLGVEVLSDKERFDWFVKTFSDQYKNLEKAVDYLKTSTHIDLKFYNTYGKSKNFIIGDEVDGERIIDTINIKIKYTIWLKTGTDKIKAREDLKHFIKDYIEAVNTDGTNSFYNSNLIKAIENKFVYVHHIKFMGINNYDTNYQSVKNVTVDMDKMTKDARVKYVPEILVANLDNIDLTFMTT